VVYGAGPRGRAVSHIAVFRLRKMAFMILVLATSSLTYLHRVVIHEHVIRERSMSWLCWQRAGRRMTPTPRVLTVGDCSTSALETVTT